MITWTDSARETLDHYTASIRAQLIATGADPDEVAGDLRRHIEEELGANKVLIATREDVRRLVTRFGPVVPEPPAGMRGGLTWRWPLAAAIAAAIVFGGWRSHFHRTYASSATIFLEMPPAIVSTHAMTAASLSSHLSLDSESWVAMIRSDKIRGLVLQSLTPAENQILDRAEKKRPASPDRLGPITVAGGAGGNIVSITAESSDPDAAAMVANKFVTTFISYLAFNSSQNEDYATNYLKTQADRLQSEVNAAWAKIQRLRKSGAGEDTQEMHDALHQHEAAESAYHALLDRLQQTDLSRSRTRLPARPLDSAQPNLDPVSPTRRTILQEGLLAGLSTFLIAALLGRALQRGSADESGSAKAT